MVIKKASRGGREAGIHDIPSCKASASTGQGESTEKSGRFGITPGPVLEALPHLSNAALRMAIALQWYLNGRDGSWQVSVKTLMARAGIKKRDHAIKAIQQLEELGLLNVDRSRGRVAHRYQWALEEPSTVPKKGTVENGQRSPLREPTVPKKGTVNGPQKGDSFSTNNRSITKTPPTPPGGRACENLPEREEEKATWRNVVDVFHEYFGAALPEIRRPAALKDRIEAACRDDPARQDLAWWAEFFDEYVNLAPLLMGQIEGTRWYGVGASLGWILKNLDRILNGEFAPPREPNNGSNDFWCAKCGGPCKGNHATPVYA